MNLGVRERNAGRRTLSESSDVGFDARPGASRPRAHIPPVQGNAADPQLFLVLATGQ